MHRWWAWVVVAVLVLFARKVRKVEGARAASIAIHSAFGTQILLGILTVLSGIAIWLAVLHQATGALLVAATVWGAHELGQAARMSVVSVYAVFANAEEAERIGRAVVEERLAACINILGPVRSIYRWQGAVETRRRSRRHPQDHRRPRPTRSSRASPACTATTCRASSPGRSTRSSALRRLGREQRRLDALARRSR